MTLGIYTGALDKLLEIGLKIGVGVMAYLYGTQGEYSGLGVRAVRWLGNRLAII